MAEFRKDDSVGEEASAVGERIKGATKNAVGAVTGDQSLEREGERQKAEGRARQAANKVMEETDGVPGASVGREPWDRDSYVTGLYDSPESAGRAYEGLTSKHRYKPEDVNVLMTDETRARHFGDVKPGKEFVTGSKAAEGLGKGSAIGGGIGAALAAILAVGTTIVVPGLGLVVAGPIAAALAGAGAGGATGGLIGALIGAGIPKDRAAEYEKGLKQGGIVIGTRPRDAEHAAELEREFGNYGGTSVRR